jgi:D-glycero-D-manno-heptose 1,7-bisphosphate phosphatase
VGNPWLELSNYHNSSPNYGIIWSEFLAQLFLVIEAVESVKKALFLDRDGVIIDYIPYLSKPEQVKLPLGAGLALQAWQAAGYELVIFTNQSGVNRGYFTLEDVNAIHEQIKQEYSQYGVKFTKILICPHQPADNCNCRKPSPKLILEYAQQQEIDLSQSWFIGDAPSDLECAIKAGCQPVLVLTGRGQETLQHLAKYSQDIPVYSTLQATRELIT